jgi:hypothetical protein
MRSREQTIGTRLSPAEYDAAKLAADSTGLNISVWLRQVIIRQTSRHDPVLETLAEQFEALRFILLNVILHLTTNGLSVNRESLTTICAKADARKADLARALLAHAIDITPKET